jgi:PIN domain nuclease of toxin-antitoxin system
MIAAVADTHTAVWYLFNNPQLSADARQAIEKAFRTEIKSEFLRFL